MRQWQSIGSSRSARAAKPSPRGELDETLTGYGPAVREAIERSSKRK